MKAHTDRTRFGNATRIFSFPKQIKPSTDKNFTRFADQISGSEYLKNIEKILKLNVIENWKFASRCQIASGLYGPWKSESWYECAILSRVWPSTLINFELVQILSISYFFQEYNPSCFLIGRFGFSINWLVVVEELFSVWLFYWPPGFRVEEGYFSLNI
jgi:hypothetical protein